MSSEQAARLKSEELPPQAALELALELLHDVHLAGLADEFPEAEAAVEHARRRVRDEWVATHPERKTSVRRLPSGSCVVGLVGSRSALTGKFLPQRTAEPSERSAGGKG